MKEPFVRELLQKAQMKIISAFQTIFNPREHEPKLAIKKKRMARNRCLQQTRNPTSLPRTLKSRRNRQEVGVSTLMSTWILKEMKSSTAWVAATMKKKKIKQFISKKKILKLGTFIQNYSRSSIKRIRNSIKVSWHEATSRCSTTSTVSSTCLFSEWVRKRI